MRVQWSPGSSPPVGDSNNTHSLTNTCGGCGTPHLAVLAGCRLLALQSESRGAEELTAGVEVGATRTLVTSVNGHFRLWTADLYQQRQLRVSKC